MVTIAGGIFLFFLAAAALRTFFAFLGWAFRR